MRTIWGVIMGLCQHSSFSGVRLPHRLRRGGRCCGCSIKFKLAPGTPCILCECPLVSVARPVARRGSCDAARRAMPRALWAATGDAARCNSSQER